MWHTRSCLRTLARSSRLRPQRRSPPVQTRARAQPSSQGARDRRTAAVAPHLSFDEAEDASPLRIRQYHDHWRRLLDLEWAEEERSVTERIESWPVARLEREGLCLTGLRHRSTGRYYDRLLLRFGFGAESRSHAVAPLRAERERSHRRHEFEVGDAVVMARQKDGGQALKGELVELSADAVAVAVSEAHTHAVDRHGDA